MPVFIFFKKTEIIEYRKRKNDNRSDFNNSDPQFYEQSLSIFPRMPFLIWLRNDKNEATIGRRILLCLALSSKRFL